MMEESEASSQFPVWWGNLSALDFNLTYANYLDSDWGSSSGNQTGQRYSPQHYSTTIYIVCFLILCCVTSLVVNIVILSSVCFMRTRVNNNLYISISLAAADTFILFFLGLGLFIFTLFPYWGFKVDAPCLYLLLEGLRMGAIMTNMFHLAALGFNHYLGILLPLRLITRRNIQYLLVVLWTIPSTLLLVDIFLLEAGEGVRCDPRFIAKSSFRMKFSIPFFTMLGLMVFIYVHIYHLVCIHQKQPLNWGHRHSSSQVTKKTIMTTIMILGSTILGWLPPFGFFMLFCVDCPLYDVWQTLNKSTHLTAVTSTLQFLLVIKPATNFYIYAFRMKEIRNAMRNMRRRAFIFLRHPQSGARFEMTEMSLMRARSRTSTCRRETHSMRLGNSQESAANGTSPRTAHQLRRGRSSVLTRHNPSNTSV